MACEHKDLYTIIRTLRVATVRVVFDWNQDFNHDKPEGEGRIFVRPMMKATRDI